MWYVHVIYHVSKCPKSASLSIHTANLMRSRLCALSKWHFTFHVTRCSTYIHPPDSAVFSCIAALLPCSTFDAAAFSSCILMAAVSAAAAAQEPKWAQAVRGSSTGRVLFFLSWITILLLLPAAAASSSTSLPSFFPASYSCSFSISSWVLPGLPLECILERWRFHSSM